MAMLATEQKSFFLHLGKIREETFSQQRGDYKDSIAEECFSPSPLNFYTILSKDFEKDIREISKNNQDFHSTSQESHKTHIKQFEQEKDFSRFLFVKEKGSFHPPSADSTFADLVLNSRQTEKTALLAKKPEKSITYTLTVFMPTRDSFHVQVNDKASVEDLIKLTLQQYEIKSLESKKLMRINANPKAYVLKFADDDSGLPDEDMPALGKTQEIGQFVKGNTSFVLCPDTSFKVVQSSTNRTKDVGLMLFKVFLPRDIGEGFVSVAYQPELTLDDLLKIVADKRDIDPQEYYFDWTDNSHSKNILLEELSHTLGELGVRGLKLKKKVYRRSESRAEKKIFGKFRRASMNLQISDEGGDAPKHITKRLGPIFTWTEASASEYKEYPVTRMTKFGGGKEEKLGIDNRKLTKIKDSKPNKRPDRKFEEVDQCSVTGTVNQFIIQYKDKKVKKYESSQAEEIVSKINFILKKELYKNM